MSFAGGGSANVIRRPAFGNTYRDANASPKPLNSAVMSYRDPNVSKTLFVYCSSLRYWTHLGLF
jgi:hypothetical protein